MTTRDDLGIEHLSHVSYIGAGGFGTVYAATDTQLERRVAVKVLGHLPSPNGLDRFDRERKAMGRLSGHPNIVTLYQTGYTASGEPYLMMELVDGGSLGQRLKAGGPMPWPLALGYVIPMCRALGFAHERGVLHRDVKPGNVLLHQGEPKLADFGIARLDDGSRTATGSAALSLAHAAPETFSDQRDERSDLYSLVSMLYQLIAGRPPFWRGDEDSTMALLNRILSEPPVPLGPTLVPPALDQLLIRGLAKDPAHRPQSAAQLQRQLEAVAAGPTDATVPGAPSEADTQLLGAMGIGPGPNRPVRHLVGLALAALATAVVGALTVALVLNARDGQEAASSTTAPPPDASVPGSPDNNTGATAGTASVPEAASTTTAIPSTDPADETPLALLGHSDVVTSLLWLGDSRLVSTSRDRTVMISNPDGLAPGGDIGATFDQHEDVVWSAAVLDDGRVATASWDGTVRIWDPSRPAGPALVLVHPARVWSVSQLPDGRLATGSGGTNGAGSDNAVRIWDLAQPQEPVAVLEGATDSVVSLAVTADGTLAGASLDGVVRLWDPERLGDDPVAHRGHTAGVWQVAALPDGRLASASLDDTVQVWDPEDPVATPLVLTHPDDVLAVTALADGQVATGCEDASVRVWDLATPGRPTRTFTGHTAQVIAVAGRPDRRIASGGWDVTIQVWSY